MQGKSGMIETDTKDILLLACKDIRHILLGFCSSKIVGTLAQGEVTTLLRRWTLAYPSIWADLNADFQAILQGLDKVVDAFPDDPWTRAMRGRASVAIRYYPAAFQDYEIALSYAPDHALLNILMGETHFFHAAHTMNDPADCYITAIFYLSRAICLYLNDPRPYITRAQACARLLKHFDYPRDSGYFIARFHEIMVDFEHARTLTTPSAHGSIDAMEQKVKALFDL
jgi:tetratricopeptide (TPR) repeat protein